ncbi:MAG TPA: hypothetical protein VMW24_02980 [Sedimentisphaerales bacterium]|nr:hypothetical protein [Sedimentisphaerales bacterium]
MRTKSLILCALILLMAQTITSAQKTEVSVQKGKIIAETANQSVAVEAGRKAVLALGSSPVVSVDNPLVDDALKLHKLIQEEKKYGDLKIDSACIIVGTAAKEGIQGALYFEIPNQYCPVKN